MRCWIWFGDDYWFCINVRFLCIFEMFVFVDILIFKDKIFGCVSCDDFVYGWWFFDVFIGDGERYDVEGGVVVYFVYGCEENCEEGEDDY